MNLDKVLPAKNGTVGKYALSIINCRMPKCNTVLQSEDDLFEPEIQPNSQGNC